MSRKADSYNRESHSVRKLFGAVNPPDSDTAITLYTAPFNVESVGFMMSIKNLSTNQDRVAKFYHDPTGTTYDDTTIIGEREITKATELDRQGMFLSIEPGGSIGVESSVGGDLKFSLWGIERPSK